MMYLTNKECIKYWIFVFVLILSFILGHYLSIYLSEYVKNSLYNYLLFFILSLFLNYAIFFNLISKLFFKIPKLKNQIPNFSGNWEGKGESSFNDTEFDVEIKITQTLKDISINAYFNKSKSEALNVYVEKKNGKEKLYYNYLNEPKGTEENLDIHYGTIILEKEDNVLTGNYFTNRKKQTKGTFECKKK